MKKQIGITLIALVITIIVLLILAGVSLSLVLGDNGILTQAQKSVKDHSEAEVVEQIKLAHSAYEMAKAGGTTESAKDFIEKKLQEDLNDSTLKVSISEETGEITVSTDVRGKEIEYSYNPNSGEYAKVVKWVDNGDLTYTNSETGQIVEVGDTVYYDSRVESYEGTGNNQGKWGILGVEQGNLLLMSKSNVSNVYLRGYNDYRTDGTIKLNNACNEFKNEEYATKVRCAKLEDINSVTGYTMTEPTEFRYTKYNGRYKEKQ